jgi:hypothetical protein
MSGRELDVLLGSSAHKRLSELYDLDEVQIVGTKIDDTTKKNCILWGLNEKNEVSGEQARQVMEPSGSQCRNMFNVWDAGKLASTSLANTPRREQINAVGCQQWCLPVLRLPPNQATQESRRSIRQEIHGEDGCDCSTRDSRDDRATWERMLEIGRERHDKNQGELR